VAVVILHVHKYEVSN